MQTDVWWIFEMSGKYLIVLDVLSGIWKSVILIPEHLGNTEAEFDKNLLICTVSDIGKQQPTKFNRLYWNHYENILPKMLNNPKYGDVTWKYFCLFLQCS